MKILTATITLALIFVLLSVDAVAQQKTVRKTKPQPKVDTKPVEKIEIKPVEKVESKPQQPQYSTQPFDLSITSLPANYLGHNLTEIYNRLAEVEKASVKGEFETTEQFRQRIATEASKPLIASLNRQSIFAFVIAGFKLESKYDADQQMMNVKADLSRVRKGVGLDDESKMSLLWSITNRSNDSYTGSNAYGAQATIERKVADFYNIAFMNYEQFPVVKTFLYRDYVKDISFSADIKMDVQKAMKAKENLRLLVACRLVEPYTIEGASYSKPTISNPRENFFRSYSLNTELLELWVFDASTGEVYLKQKPR